MSSTKSTTRLFVLVKLESAPKKGQKYARPINALVRRFGVDYERNANFFVGFLSRGCVFAIQKNTMKLGQKERLSFFASLGEGFFGRRSRKST